MTATARDRRALDAGEVHVWKAPLAAAGASPELLAPDERRHASRLRRREDRRRYVAAHCALRAVLGHYLGIRPASVAFSVGRYGKPALAPASDVTFNLTHSAEVAAIAVARGRDVGVDVERVDPALRLQDVVGLALTARERGRVAACPEPERRRAVLAIWTVKEACAKARGVGMRLDFGRFEVELPPVGTSWATTVGAGMPLSFRTLPVALGYVGALAVEGAAADVRTRWWPA